MALFRPALFIVGLMLVALAVMMAVPVLFLAEGQAPDWHAFVISAIVTLVCGATLVALYRDIPDRLHPRQVFMITGLSWAVIPLFAATPLFLCHLRLSIVDALFETVSGITTTGSTVISGLDGLADDLLLWRSMLQWLGGFGMIAMAVTVMPFLRVGGMRLFRSESSEWSEKALPRARHVGKLLLNVYLTLTVLCALAYVFAGMSVFEAVNHAMTTLATGGFSTSDASLGHFNSPLIYWVAVVFMILGALPFLVYGRYWNTLNGAVFGDTQIRGFLAILALSIAAMTVYLMVHAGRGFEDALTSAAVNVTSIFTTTGYATEDYQLWGALAAPVFFFLTVIGGCSGSTAGGMKVFRLQLSLIMLREQIMMLVHPSAVINRRYNGQPVGDEIFSSAVAFSFVFLSTLAVLTMLITALGVDFVTALSGTAQSMTSTGPGLGSVIGPAGNFQSLPDGAKLLLCVGMVLGRLEFLSLIVLFSPVFWRG